MKKIVLTSASCLLLLTTVLNSHEVSAQVYTNKETRKHKIDSTSSKEYPYVLPIMGRAATKKGFELPYSAGIGINVLMQQSDVIINNLQIGFNDGPKTNLDEIIKFNESVASTQGVNIRPDVWILPFLNVYGIFAKSKTATEIDVSLYAPTEPTASEIMQISTKAEFDATTMGFGITPTMGVANGWIALDMNFTWTDIAELKDPAYSFVFGPRVGKTFEFKKEHQNLAIWVGGFRVNISSGTSGSLALKDIINTDDINGKIDDAYTGLDAAQSDVDTWWNGLTPVEQLKPQNITKYEGSNRLIDRAGTFVGRLDAAVNNVEASTVQYSLDKRQANMWNFIAGSQFQFNKHWMIRAEFGFFGQRTQFIGGLQYRFGL